MSEGHFTRWERALEILRLGDQVLTVRRHWRLLVAVLAAQAVWFLVWTAAFPHTFWFDRFWGSNVVGLVTGVMIGTHWHRQSDPTFRLLTADRGLFVFMAAVFVTYAVVGLGRDLASQERVLKNIRQLATNETTSIEWDGPGSASGRTASPEGIADFQTILAGAELFTPNHEQSVATVRIELRRRGEPLRSLPAEIREHHPADLVLPFNEGFGFHHVLLPGAAQWIHRTPAASDR